MQSEKGKYIFGVCKVGERGQIVIPKEARDVFGIKPGDSLLMLGDEKRGMAIVKTEIFQEVADEIFGEGSKSPAINESPAPSNENVKTTTASEAKK